MLLLLPVAAPRDLTGQLPPPLVEKNFFRVACIGARRALHVRLRASNYI